MQKLERKFYQFIGTIFLAYCAVAVTIYTIQHGLDYLIKQGII